MPIPGGRPSHSSATPATASAAASARSPGFEGSDITNTMAPARVLAMVLKVYFRGRTRRAQIRPRASIASATRTKPAMLAPAR